MLTFNQLQEKKTKIKINPNVKDQYEHHKKDADGNTIPHEELTEKKKKPSVHDDYYDPMEDPTFDPHEAEATRGQSGRGTKGKMNTRKKYKVKESAVLDANTKIKNEKARKKDEAKLAKLTHIYKGMKTGQYNSYEPEGEELKEYSPNVSYQAKGGKKSGKLGKSSVYSLRDKDESKKEFRKSHTKDIKDGLLKKEEAEYVDEERSARKMNVRTKGTIKKQIEKDAAAEAKRRAKKTGEYKETPKRKPKLKKPSQLTTVKAEPKKAKPKAKPVAAVKKVAPKPKAKPAAKKKAPAKKPAAKKVAPKKAAPKVDKKAADIDRPKGNLTDKARAWVKRGVKRHRKATQGARVFAKGAAKGAKDTVKFAGKVKKVFTGEGLMSFKAYLLSEGYQRDPDRQEKDRKTSKQTDPSKDGFTGISNDIGEIMRQNAAMKKAAAKKTKKEEVEIDEATRLKKEKGYDKGGTKKAPSPVMQAVIAKIEKEHGKGSIAGRTQQKKKVKGAKSTEGTGKYLKRAKEKAAYAAKAKKAGFKSTQAYTDTMARYGGESNYKKGKGLGT